MTQSEEQLWAELRALRAELDDLKVVRERLAAQAGALHTLRTELEAKVETVDKLAQQADELLQAKDEADEAQA